MRKAIHRLLPAIATLLCLTGCVDEQVNFNTEDIITQEDLTLGDHEIAFVHISDVHRSDVSIAPTLYYLNRTPASFGLLTGDVMATDEMLDELAASDKPMLLIPGNHDAYPAYTHSVGQHAFRTSVLQRIGQHEHVTFGSSDGNYWTCDIRRGRHTLRVIGIDQFEVESLNEGPNAQICVYSQQQVDWLVALLERSSQCDGLIIAIHAGFGNRHTGQRDMSNTNDFISIYARDYDNAYDYGGTKNTLLIPDVVEAYLTGVNLDGKRYANSTQHDTLVVSTHFTEAADNFVGYFGGHAHWDMVEYLNGYPRQLQALIAYCGAGTGSERNDLIKGTSNKDFYNFNVNIIDFEQRRLRIVRKGANRKVDGNTRDSIAFHF